MRNTIQLCFDANYILLMRNWKPLSCVKIADSCKEAHTYC